MQMAKFRTDFEDSFALNLRPIAEFVYRKRAAVLFLG